MVPGCVDDGGKADIKEDRLTVGKVQGEVKVGRVTFQVAKLLDSPNIVTMDEKRREVWTYDRVSIDRVDTARSSFAEVIIVSTAARVGRSITGAISSDLLRPSTSKTTPSSSCAPAPNITCVLSKIPCPASISFAPWNRDCFCKASPWNSTL